MMTSDPFQFKDLPKWHPRRLLPTLLARFQDFYSKVRFDAYELPRRCATPLPECPRFDREDTAITERQMQYLWEAAQCALQQQPEGHIVEVGCYRGVTTRALAQAVAPNEVIGVDPFIGWGGAEADYARFRRRVGDLQNVTHERKTSGEAARTWEYGPTCFIFIDAVHDYWNTCHDLRVWGQHLSPGGYLAAHDTDQVRFAGTRRAVYEIADTPSFTLHTHVDNLTILRKNPEL